MKVELGLFGVLGSVFVSLTYLRRGKPSEVVLWAWAIRKAAEQASKQCPSYFCFSSCFQVPAFTSLYHESSPQIAFGQWFLTAEGCKLGQGEEEEA